MSQNSLSIIVPVLNEAGNLKELIERININCYQHGIIYEVIIIDDHSKDNTDEVISELSVNFPVRLFKKEGKRGKAYSLLEGFSKAQHQVMAFMDGDLQYPPEALGPMFEKIKSGADVVITNRSHEGTSAVRKALSRGFVHFFGNFLHKLPFDIQSGMKMFRSEVRDRFNVKPSPWTYDLEFLLKARHAGYTIESVPIVFSKRTYGSTKINIFSSSMEIGLSALKMKFKDFGVMPFTKEVADRIGRGFHYNSRKFVMHTNLNIGESAFTRATKTQVLFIFLLILFITLAFLRDGRMTVIAVIGFMTFLYFVDLLFNLFVVLRSFIKKPEIQISEAEINSVEESNWPTYTIFCPLYKEWSVVDQFIQAIDKMDYPREKLQVILLLEEDDKETLENLKYYQLPAFVEAHVIPDSQPKTKPKALNFGLSRARGEYIVVYDAEDMPEADQLKKAVLAFAKSDPRTICIQAKLNFYNPYQNILTRAFTAEYSLWFDLVLPGLQSINAPIPLGGTSNHFRKADIQKLKGWDPFNVTEDCDLGMRIAKKGYVTAIIDSTTYEEANSDFNNWFNQRTRWIKGYIQTYLVHTRYLRKFFKESIFYASMFQLIVGARILCMLINPFMWILTATYFIFRPILGESIEKFFPAPILYMGLFALVLGNFLYLYYYMVGLAKREYYGLIKYTGLVPLYWLSISMASWYAVVMILVKPHHWYKTTHGLHLKNKPFPTKESPMNPLQNYTALAAD